MQTPEGLRWRNLSWDNDDDLNLIDKAIARRVGYTIVQHSKKFWSAYAPNGHELAQYHPDYVNRDEDTCWMTIPSFISAEERSEDFSQFLAILPENSDVILTRANGVWTCKFTYAGKVFAGSHKSMGNSISMAWLRYHDFINDWEETPVESNDVNDLNVRMLKQMGWSLEKLRFNKWMLWHGDQDVMVIQADSEAEAWDSALINKEVPKPVENPVLVWDMIRNDMGTLVIDVNQGDTFGMALVRGYLDFAEDR